MNGVYSLQNFYHNQTAIVDSVLTVSDNVTKYNPGPSYENILRD